MFFIRSNIKLPNNTKLLADTSYLEVSKLFSSSLIPHKSSKNNPLTKSQKIENREISRLRILVENVIGSFKRFRILLKRYRNRRKGLD